MLRLIITLILAAAVGVGAGMAQYRMTMQNLDERFADFRANPVAANAVDVEKAAVSKTEVTESAQMPKVEVVGGTTFDFGNMQQGASKQHTFVFRNIGKAPLKLQNQGSSCRCTIGTLKDSVLEPGQETGVTLDWKATGVLNQFSQTATIGTNDPEHSQVLLTVRGLVSRTVIIEPSTITLGDISVTEGAKQSAFIFGYGEDKLEVTNMRWENERSATLGSVEITPVDVDKETFPHHDKANGAARLDLVIKPGMALGPVDSKIIFDTNIKNIANLELTVTGKIVGDIQILGGSSYDVERNLYNFGTVNKAQGAVARLHISAQGPQRNDLKFEVAEVIPAESLQVTVGEPKRQNNRTLYPLTCTIPENAPAAMFPGTNSTNFGKVIIKTNHPSIPEVRLNLRLIVE